MTTSLPSAPKPGHHEGWKERNSFYTILLPWGRLTDSKLRAVVLTKVRVTRDPRKQVTTTARTKPSRRLDQMCGNSSNTAVITPSKPAN